eukprot:1798967-Rhodomonas_salina.1
MAKQHARKAAKLTKKQKKKEEQKQEKAEKAEQRQVERELRNAQKLGLPKREQPLRACSQK